MLRVWFFYDRLKTLKVITLFTYYSSYNYFIDYKYFYNTYIKKVRLKPFCINVSKNLETIMKSNAFICKVYKLKL